MRYHQRPADGGCRCQRYEGSSGRVEVSIERNGGFDGEPGEAEHDQADARRDDRVVHEGFEVARVQGCEEDKKSTSRRAEQGRPRRARPGDEEEPSEEQAGEHPLFQEVLRAARHQPDRNTSMRP
jgi:hypothetical protein